MRKTTIYGLIFLFYLSTALGYDLSSLADYDYSLEEEVSSQMNMTKVYLTLGGKGREYDFPEYSHFCIGLFDEYFEAYRLEINPETNETEKLRNPCTREHYYIYINNEMKENVELYLADPDAYDEIPLLMEGSYEDMGLTITDEELIVNKDLSVIGIGTIPLSKFNTSNHDAILKKVDELDVYYYPRRNITESLRLGVMAGSSPPEFSDGKSIGLMEYTSFTLAGLKAVNYKLDNLLNKVNEIAGVINFEFEKLIIRNLNATNATTISSTQDNDLLIDASNAGGDVIIWLA